MGMLTNAPGSEATRSHQLSWLVHDLVAGSMAGGLAGFVLSWFRYAAGVYVDHWLIDLSAIGLGAAGAITALRLERRRRGVGPVTVTVWVVGLGTLAFIAFVVYALSQFE